MTDHLLTEALCTGVTVHLELPGAVAAEAEAVELCGPVRLAVTDAVSPPAITDPPGLALPAPVTLTVTVTARRVHFATELAPLDARLLALAADMPPDQAEPIGAALARIREAWRGGDHYPDAAEALTTIAEAAAELAERLDRDDPP
jgi:hypothetical protein